MSVGQRFEDKLGEHLASHGADNNLERFEPFADDPIGFAEEVLGVQLWKKQREVARSVRDNRKTVVVGGNGVGKDFAAAALSLWAVCARRMRVLITASSDRTAGEVFMRRELMPLYSGAEVSLPGELYSRKLEIPGTGAGVLSMTGRNVSTMTGQHHAEGQLAVLSEAQGVPAHAWEAMAANLIGEDARHLALGNPLHPTGKFYQAARSDDWNTIQIAALDHPNIQQQREVIPGGPTVAWIQEAKREWGTDSRRFRARVHGEFSETHADSLFDPEWLIEAARRYTDHTFEEDREEERAVLGVDVARRGRDRTVVCARRGRYVEGFWHLDTESTQKAAEQVYGITKELHENRNSQVWRVIVDAVGVGGGLVDQLREIMDLGRQEAVGLPPQSLKTYPVQVCEYKGGRNAHESDEFRNWRSETYWRLRDRFKAGNITIAPFYEELFEELAQIRATLLRDDRIALETKDDLKARLGRSPDFADALAMAHAEPKEVPAGPITW